ncbi:MAG: T9SS type A sorting domain-containing protein, partial [Bacteroidetes bacterium]|nr:T9SS type A sorting domain-containing protein [Bacteroidota bacterium]
RLDSSFGVNGFSSLHINIFNFCTGLVVQPDGKIVISGYVQKSEYDNHNTFIARYRTDGSLDPDFGDEGIVLTHYANATTTNSLIIRPDGKLVRGSTYNIYDAHSAYMLESFNPDGSIDAGFGDNGTAKFIFGQGQGGSWNNLMFGMALQPDGKIVCTGETGQNEDEVMGLCRFNEDGTVDNAFGDDGGKIVTYENTYVDSKDLCFQPDGKIITIATPYTSFPHKGFLLIRYTSDGQLDPGFGENGISSIYDDTAILSTSSVHYLNTGKIFTSGSLLTYNQQITRTMFARFNNDNVLATHFKNVKAVENKEGISISWQTLNESNTQSYTIERSGNAQDYRDIANIPAKGQTENSYNYTDKNPLAGDNYYRIRENARNGTVSYSQTLKVNFIQSGVLSLYPNPAKSTVTVKGLDKNSASVIKILDMQGREISSQHFDKVSTATLNIRSLAQGAYFIQITQGEKVVRLKMVKE